MARKGKYAGLAVEAEATADGDEPKSAATKRRDWRPSIEMKFDREAIFGKWGQHGGRVDSAARRYRVFLFFESMFSVSHMIASGSMSSPRRLLRRVSSWRLGQDEVQHPWHLWCLRRCCMALFSVPIMLWRTLTENSNWVLLLLLMSTCASLMAWSTDQAIMLVHQTHIWVTGWHWNSQDDPQDAPIFSGTLAPLF
jgi:hypothetical protein